MNELNKIDFIKEMLGLPEHKVIIVEYRDIPEDSERVLLPEKSKRFIGNHENAAILDQDEHYIAVARLAGSCAICALYEKTDGGLKRVK